MNRVYGYPSVGNAGIWGAGLHQLEMQHLRSSDAALCRCARHSGRGSSTPSAPVPSSHEARGAFESHENTKNLKENPVQLSIPFLQLTV